MSTLACTPLASGSDRADAQVNDAADEDAGPQGCPAIEARTVVDIGTPGSPDEDVVFDGDTRWTCQALYRVHANVVQATGRLTVEAGTTVQVADGRYILVAREASIQALGSALEPIHFEPLSRPASRGQWRGLILLGAADTVFGTSAIVEGTSTAGTSARYGGGDDDGSCGELRYVTIAFAGGRLSDYYIPAGGLTLAGCGRQTRIDFVQVHGGTDGIGVIGGAAPLRHVVVTDAQEDGIEWTGGYRGLIQFAIVQLFHGSSGALKGSRREGDPSGDPESAPYVYNVTLVGVRDSSPVQPVRPANGFETGILMAGGTLGAIRNSYIQGFHWWINVGDAETAARVAREGSGVSATMMTDRDPSAGGGLPGTGSEDPEGDGAFDEAGFFSDAMLRNRVDAAAALAAPYDRVGSDFSAALNVLGGSYDAPPPGWDGLFTRADYHGAIDGAELDPAARELLDWTTVRRDGELTTWTISPQE